MNTFDEIQEFKKYKIDLDDILDNIKYNFKGYTPKKDTVKFLEFRKLIRGELENVTPLVHYVTLDNILSSQKNIAVMCFRGFAKLETLDSPILTVDGWKKMRDIKEGDILFNRYGKKTTVVYKTPTQTPMIYKMTLCDGTVMEVGDEHLHLVWINRAKPSKRRKSEKVLTTKQLLEKPLFVKNKNKKCKKDGKGHYRYGIPIAEPIEFDKKVYDIEPYVFGYVFGNGSFSDGAISCHANDFIEIGKYFGKLGYTIKRFKFTSENGIQFCLGYNLFKKFKNLRSRTKFIPKEYMFGAIEQRVELLRGLMDSDGTISKNGSISYTSYSKKLASDVAELVRSLGGYATIKEYYRKETSSMYYMVRIKMKHFNPFRLTRKAKKWKPAKYYTKAIVSLEPIGHKDGCCIVVSEQDHTYISRNYTVTHNSSIAEEIFWYMACFNKLPGFGDLKLALYISDSIDNGVKTMKKSMDLTYENSEFLQNMLPNISDTDVTTKLDKGYYSTQKEISFINAKKEKSWLKMYGAQTGVRGTKSGIHRPRLAILDDLLQKEEDARSKPVIDSIESTVYSDVEDALHPTKRKTIWFGTPFNDGDPLVKAVLSKSWSSSVYPVCEKFPCERDEFKGAWEDRFNYDAVLSTYEKRKGVGKESMFYREMMLRISPKENRVIQDSDIQYYDERNMYKNRGYYNWYITTDFATSEKHSADLSVILVWAVNNNNDFMLVDAKMGRWLMDKNVDLLFQLSQYYQPLSVGIEVTGQQGGFISWIRKEMVNRNAYFTLASSNNNGSPGIRPMKDKFSRFMEIQPRFAMKKFYFPDWKEHGTTEQKEFIYELENELKKVTVSGFKSAHDDILDAISMLGSMKIIAPTYSNNIKLNKNSVYYFEDDEEDGNSNPFIV